MKVLRKAIRCLQQWADQLLPGNTDFFPLKYFIEVLENSTFWCCRIWRLNLSELNALVPWSKFRQGQFIEKNSLQYGRVQHVQESEGGCGSVGWHRCWQMPNPAPMPSEYALRTIMPHP